MLDISPSTCLISGDVVQSAGGGRAVLGLHLLGGKAVLSANLGELLDFFGGDAVLPSYCSRLSGLLGDDVVLPAGQVGVVQLGTGSRLGGLSGFPFGDVVLSAD